METELIYSKIVKISKGVKPNKSAGIHITDQYLESFTDKDVLVKIELITKKSISKKSKDTK